MEPIDGRSTIDDGRWEGLAAAIGAWSDHAGHPDPQLTAALQALERRLGLEVLDGPDPAPCVTARRFGRLHRAAMAGARCADVDVTLSVDAAASVLAAVPAGRLTGSRHQDVPWLPGSTESVAYAPSRRRAVSGPRVDSPRR